MKALLTRLREPESAALLDNIMRFIDHIVSNKTSTTPEATRLLDWR